MVELLIKGQTWGGEVNGGEESKIRQTSNKLRESKDVKQRFVVILKEKVEIPYSEGEERETMEDVWGLRRKEERAGEKKRKRWWRAVSGPSEGVCRLLTLFPRCSLQRARIMKRARGFRQWEGKKITSKLAVHLNWDNPKTVVLNACCTRSDVPFSFFFSSPAPFCRF